MCTVIGSSDNVLFNESMGSVERVLSTDSFNNGCQDGCSCLFEGVEDAKGFS